MPKRSKLSRRIFTGIGCVLGTLMAYIVFAITVNELIDRKVIVACNKNTKMYGHMSDKFISESRRELIGIFGVRSFRASPDNSGFGVTFLFSPGGVGCQSGLGDWLPGPSK